MSKPRLFRAKVAYDNAVEPVPDNPMAANIFGLSDGRLQAHLSPCITSRGDVTPQGGRRLSFTVVGVSDEEGKVLSLNVNEHDANGKWLSSYNAALAVEDALQLGKAISAVIDLTPEGGA